MNGRLSSFLTLALTCAAIGSTGAASQTVHYATGFEAPTFVLGPLAGTTFNNGQDGWLATGDSSTNPDLSRIVVQTALTKTGAQAAEIDATGQPTPYAHIRRNTFITITPSEPILDIAFDLRLASAATTPSEWSVQAQAGPGPGSGLLEWWVDVAGEIHITSATGAVATGFHIQRDTWMHVTTRLDYAAQTCSVLIDNQVVGTVAALPGATWWYHAFTSLIFSSPGDDQMYVDNFSLTTHDGQLVANYCTAGVSTNGCQPTLSASGTPSASATAGFTIVANSVEGGVNGTFFYGVSGRGAFPWSATSSSYVCVKSPLRRIGVAAAGGASGTCSGAISSDFLAFMAATPGALGQPLTAGQAFNVQLWYRDPPAPRSTNLSDALEFTLLP